MFQAAADIFFKTAKERSAPFSNDAFNFTLATSPLDLNHPSPGATDVTGSSQAKGVWQRIEERPGWLVGWLVGCPKKMGNKWGEVRGGGG